jgi:hypothetical protein
MARAHVETEESLSRGWSYRVVLSRDNGISTTHTVTLHWADHDHWSGGRLAPSRVVEIVLLHLLSHAAAADALPERFDAAKVRRWCPGIDSELRAAC